MDQKSGAQTGYPAQQGYPQGQYPQGQPQGQYPQGQPQGQYSQGQNAQGQPEAGPPPGSAPVSPTYVVMQPPQNTNRGDEVGAVASMTGAYVASCLTFWLCANLLFGGIGFIIAIVGTVYIGKDNALSKKLNIASIVISIVGMILTIIIIIVVIVYYVNRTTDYLQDVSAEWSLAEGSDNGK